MAEIDNDVPVVISGDEARAGVTGHHVRYVLAFGLAGVLIAYLAIGLYYEYDTLARTLANMFAVDGPLWRRLVFYTVPLGLAAVAAVLLLGLCNMVWGRSPNTSQTLMRWRVILQFIALWLVMGAFFLSARS